jgi:mono/diheme cytochrome c family protein
MTAMRVSLLSRLTFLLSLLAVATVVGRPIALSAQGKAAAAKRDDGRYAKEIQPLLKTYCSKCHSGTKVKGDLSFDKFPDEAAVLRDRKLWGAVLRNLDEGVMPPDDQPQPTDAELERLKKWVREKLDQIDAAAPRNPGRVTLRRLNRAEYNNTIRDLVGVDFQPAEDFPSDDVGYGFDNIGDVLSMPPILLEKYVTAAEKILDAAIVTQRSTKAKKMNYAASELQRTGPGGLSRGTAMGIFSNGAAYVEHDFPRAGEYLVRTRAYGQQAGDEPVRMAFRVGGKEVFQMDVKAVQDKPAAFERRVEVDAGRQRVAFAFLNDFYDPAKKQDRNLYVEHIEIEGPVNVKPSSASMPETHARIFTCTPDGKNATACARVILRNFARRAFRRNVTDEEVDRLMKLFAAVQADGENFEESIKLTLEAVLVSPHFLFRVEVDQETKDPQGIYPINEFELANRLSYFLWSSMPDEELFGLARRNELRKPGVLEQQIKRMLRERKAEAFVENFAGQWLQLRTLDRLTPDKDDFPAFDDVLRRSMRTEVEIFFTQMLREDRSILDFLDANFTYVNERLAAHYGIEGVRGDKFVRTQIKGDQRGGILMMAGVLAVTSNPTRTSPVKRGKWILENVLGAPPPPPPPGVELLSEEKAAITSGSLRQRMEKHRKSADCAGCHQRLDPLGFGFENYDAIGGWRTKDGPFVVDPAGTLPGGQAFSSPVELKKLLRKREEDFTRCLTEKLLTFATGRGMEPADKPYVDQIVKAVAKNQYKFSTLLLEVMKSDPFQKRSRKRGE